MDGVRAFGERHDEDVRARSVVLASTLVVSAWLSACAKGSGTEAGGTAAAELDGRTFLSTSATSGGKPYELVPGTRIRLTFEDGRISANAGCNQLSGAYSLDGSTLVVDNMASTQMACDPARHAQDEWLSALLVAGPTVALTGDDLTLATATEQLRLQDRRVADPDRPLVGTAWRVESIITPDAVTSVAGGEKAAFTFAVDGRVSGNTGCNQFSGPYQKTADTITFGAIAMTKMACTGGADTVERAVVALFDGRPVTYKIEADQLTMTNPDGHGLQLRAG
jgi:heat shock protein HslJ